MKRPWQVWLAFTACVVVVAAAMGWLTVHALRLDRERSAARAEAELEQRISLALWRMDTKLTPLIAEEAARPHLFYNSFITIDAPAGKGLFGAEQAPSPLLLSPASNVILNFDAATDGSWNSPQAPPPEQTSLACANGMTIGEIDENRTKLAELASQVDVERLIALLPQQPLPQWKLAQQADASAQTSQVSDDGAAQQVQQPFYGNVAAANAPAPSRSDENAQQAQQRSKAQAIEPQSKPQYAQKAYGDLEERNTRVQSAAQQEFTKQRGGNYLLQNSGMLGEAPVIENVSRPLWVGDQLLLARRVVRGGETVVQGSWLDWKRLKQELLAETADLVPGADLTPVRNEDDADPTRMLAGVPVQLVVAHTAAKLATLASADAPLQWALGVGWIALMLAVAAVAGLLWGVLALSERRAAFVSSVTHELRTPLTTFRMYAEMLARDMVPSAERRREYLQTLKTEAERLTHLVENVLSYARLERGRTPRRTERTTPGVLVERFAARLAERASQSDMRLETTIDDGVHDLPLLTDVGVVEQILFNLVDNAAKYAARATDRRIHLDATREGSFAVMTVRDHGAGFASPRDAARSAPFSKSAQEAAETAPGVGLGLALCRRLARELGGRLDIVPANGAPTGAAVALRLPINA